MVLDVVVGAAREFLRDLRPAVPVGLVQLQDEHVLLPGPLVLLDVGIQVVVPSVQDHI